MTQDLFNEVRLSMRFDSDACRTTLCDINMQQHDKFLEWHGFDKPVLNPKLQEMDLSKDQSAAIVKGLFEKLQDAFDGSGISRDPCNRYFEYLLYEVSDEDMNWGGA